MNQPDQSRVVVGMRTADHEPNRVARAHAIPVGVTDDVHCIPRTLKTNRVALAPRRRP